MMHRVESSKPGLCGQRVAVPAGHRVPSVVGSGRTGHPAVAPAALKSEQPVNQNGTGRQNGTPPLTPETAYEQLKMMQQQMAAMTQLMAAQAQQNQQLLQTVAQLTQQVAQQGQLLHQQQSAAQVANEPATAGSVTTSEQPGQLETSPQAQVQPPAQSTPREAVQPSPEPSEEQLKHSAPQADSPEPAVPATATAPQAGPLAAAASRPGDQGGRWLNKKSGRKDRTSSSPGPPAVPGANGSSPAPKKGFTADKRVWLQADQVQQTTPAPQHTQHSGSKPAASQRIVNKTPTPGPSTAGESPDVPAAAVPTPVLPTPAAATETTSPRAVPVAEATAHQAPPTAGTPADAVPDISSLEADTTQLAQADPILHAAQSWAAQGTLLAARPQAPGGARQIPKLRGPAGDAPLFQIPAQAANTAVPQSDKSKLTAGSQPGGPAGSTGQAVPKVATDAKPQKQRQRSPTDKAAAKARDASTRSLTTIPQTASMPAVTLNKDVPVGSASWLAFQMSSGVFKTAVPGSGTAAGSPALTGPQLEQLLSKARSSFKDTPVTDLMAILNWLASSQLPVPPAYTGELCGALLARTSALAAGDCIACIQAAGRLMPAANQPLTPRVLDPLHAVTFGDVLIRLVGRFGAAVDETPVPQDTTPAGSSTGVGQQLLMICDLCNTVSHIISAHPELLQVGGGQLTVQVTSLLQHISQASQLSSLVHVEQLVTLLASLPILGLTQSSLPTGFLTHVLSAVMPQLSHLNPSHLASFAMSMMQLCTGPATAYTLSIPDTAPQGDAHPHHPWVTAVLDCSVAHLAQFTLDQVADLSYAVASIGYRPSDGYMNKLTACTARLLESPSVSAEGLVQNDSPTAQPPAATTARAGARAVPSPTTLSRLAVGMALLCNKQAGSGWVVSLRAAMEVQHADMGVAELIDVLWGICVLGGMPSGAAINSLTAKTLNHFKGLPTPQLLRVACLPTYVARHPTSTAAASKAAVTFSDKWLEEAQAALVPALTATQAPATSAHPPPATSQVHAAATGLSPHEIIALVTAATGMLTLTSSTTKDSKAGKAATKKLHLGFLQALSQVVVDRAEGWTDAQVAQLVPLLADVTTAGGSCYLPKSAPGTLKLCDRMDAVVAAHKDAPVTSSSTLFPTAAAARPGTSGTAAVNASAKRARKSKVGITAAESTSAVAGSYLQLARVEQLSRVFNLMNDCGHTPSAGLQAAYMKAALASSPADLSAPALSRALIMHTTQVPTMQLPTAWLEQSLPALSNNGFWRQNSLGALCDVAITLEHAGLEAPQELYKGMKVKAELQFQDLNPEQLVMLLRVLGRLEPCVLPATLQQQLVARVKEASPSLDPVSLLAAVQACFKVADRPAVEADCIQLLDDHLHAVAVQQLGKQAAQAGQVEGLDAAGMWLQVLQLFGLQGHEVAEDRRPAYLRMLARDIQGVGPVQLMSVTELLWGFYEADEAAECMAAVAAVWARHAPVSPLRTCLMMVAAQYECLLHWGPSCPHAQPMLRTTLQRLATVLPAPQEQPQPSSVLVPAFLGLHALASCDEDSQALMSSLDPVLLAQISSSLKFETAAMTGGMQQEERKEQDLLHPGVFTAFINLANQHQLSMMMDEQQEEQEGPGTAVDGEAVVAAEFTDLSSRSATSSSSSSRNNPLRQGWLSAIASLGAWLQQRPSKVEPVIASFYISICIVYNYAIDPSLFNMLVDVIGDRNKALASEQVVGLIRAGQSLLEQGTPEGTSHGERVLAAAKHRVEALRLSDLSLDFLPEVLQTAASLQLSSDWHCSAKLAVMDAVIQCADLEGDDPERNAEAWRIIVQLLEATEGLQRVDDATEAFCLTGLQAALAGHLFCSAPGNTADRVATVAFPMLLYKEGLTGHSNKVTRKFKQEVDAVRAQAVQAGQKMASVLKAGEVPSLKVHPDILLQVLDILLSKPVKLDEAWVHHMCAAIKPTLHLATVAATGSSVEAAQQYWSLNGLGRLLACFAQANVNPGLLFLEDVAAAIQPQLRAGFVGPATMAQLLWVLVKFGCKPSASWLDRFYTASLPSLHLFATASMLQLHVPDQSVLAAALAAGDESAAARARPWTATGRQMQSLLLSFQHIDTVPSDTWLQECCKVVATCSRFLTHQEISLISISLAKLVQLAPRLVQGGDTAPIPAAVTNLLMMELLTRSSRAPGQHPATSPSVSEAAQLVPDQLEIKYLQEASAELQQVLAS